MNPISMALHAGKMTLQSGNVRRNTVVQIVIATIAFILLIRIWPCGLVQKHIESKQQAYHDMNELEGDYFTHADKKLQTVYFSQKHLSRLTLYAGCTAYEKGDFVTFRIYNDEFSCIYEEKYSCEKIAKNGYLRTEPELDVEPGKIYYYEVLVPEEEEVTLVLPTADRSTLAQTENGTLYVDGIINDAVSLVADFSYTEALSIWRILLYDILILTASLFVMFGVILLLDRMEPWNEEISRYGKWAVTGIAGIMALIFFFFAVIRNVFGGEGLDRLVYAIGILSATFWLMCLVWFPREVRKPSRLAPEKQMSLIWRNYIQTVCFGLLFYALCQYVNADREYYHYVNTRWMLILLGIAFLMIYTEKELCNLVSGIYLGVSVVGAFLYCTNYAGEEQEVYLAKLTAGVVIVWGLVVINTMLQYKKGFWRQVSKPFFVMWITFSLLMYLYRYEKVWVFTATLPFAVLLLYNLSAAGRSRLLKNFTNGILLSFGLVTLFCMQHRPYHYWILYRYGGIFHTVACNGMYLTVVLGAALAKLFGRMRDKTEMTQRCWKELFLVGCGAGFMLLTMSRTALLATIVNAFMVIGLTAATYRKKPIRIVQECVLTLGAVLVCFPLVFSSVRMIPALVNDPVHYDVESQDESFSIYEGEAIDSDKYMTIERFLDIFFGRFQTAQEDADNRDVETVPQENDLLASVKPALPVMLPTAEEQSENEESRSYVLEGNTDISNGRFQIYKDYFKALTLSGHPKMSDIENMQEEYTHAHNSYLQVAYNFGIPAGILFLFLCALTLWRAILLFYRHGRKYSIYLVPFSLVVVFGFVSLTEWAFHPCIPAGFCFLFLQMLLMQEPRGVHGAGQQEDTAKR